MSEKQPSPGSGQGESQPKSEAIERRDALDQMWRREKFTDDKWQPIFDELNEESEVSWETKQFIKKLQEARDDGTTLTMAEAATLFTEKDDSNNFSELGKEIVSRLGNYEDGKSADQYSPEQKSNIRLGHMFQWIGRANEVRNLNNPDKLPENYDLGRAQRDYHQFSKSRADIPQSFKELVFDDALSTLRNEFPEVTEARGKKPRTETQARDTRSTAEQRAGSVTPVGFGVSAEGGAGVVNRGSTKPPESKPPLVAGGEGDEGEKNRLGLEFQPQVPEQKDLSALPVSPEDIPDILRPEVAAPAAQPEESIPLPKASQEDQEFTERFVENLNAEARELPSLFAVPVSVVEQGYSLEGKDSSELNRFYKERLSEPIYDWEEMTPRAAIEGIKKFERVEEGDVSDNFKRTYKEAAVGERAYWGKDARFAERFMDDFSNQIKYENKSRLGKFLARSKVFGFWRTAFSRRSTSERRLQGIRHHLADKLRHAAIHGSEDYYKRAKLGKKDRVVFAEMADAIDETNYVELKRKRK